ncbi:hypothetical protein [Sutcliffiella sp. NC1]|uniref:hypothetical protein n=1 Tax=Sutcliffiella sp. NC1 TaxID=3004096 RepID=UPI0022DE9474|nr:hypothetical protein [Sutcliffiella sp. NC1]WBL16379.1 hypothetical protein O1A01_07030 [Sutcliffiella sp. NC1]
MPYYPENNGSAASSYGEEQNHELFSDFALLAHYYHFSHWDIMKLPHSFFLAYRKQAYVSELKKSEEGREYLKKAYRYTNPRRDADLSAIRSLTGYTSMEIGGE